MLAQILIKIFINLFIQTSKVLMIKFKSLESLGMLFAVMAYFSFSLLDAVQKTAVIYHSVFQLLFIKYCFVLILSLIESQRKKIFYFTSQVILKFNYFEVFYLLLNLDVLFYHLNIYH